MSLYQQLGWIAEISPRSSARRGVVRHASRLTGTHGFPWPIHSRLAVSKAGSAGLNVPPCIARAAPLDAAAIASASTVLPAEVAPLRSATSVTADITAQCCSEGLGTLTTTATDKEGPHIGSLELPQHRPSGRDSPPGCHEPGSGPAADPLADSPPPVATPSTVSTASPEATTTDNTAEALCLATTVATPATPPDDHPSEQTFSRGLSPKEAEVETEAVAEASSSGSRTSWPGGRNAGAQMDTSITNNTRRLGPPVYAAALTNVYIWPKPKLNPRARPSFLADYPVPPGKTFNVNSFWGKSDPHSGKYLVPERSYRAFLDSYVAALEEGYQMYLTENYHQRVYKFFLEFDWDWDTNLALVMEVTPQLIALATQIASDFYRLPYPNVITSIRTPYKVHLNFPQLLTTELLACLCRDRLLEACVEKLGPRYGSSVDWERLIDFPHGSLRLMGSRKANHMDSDPTWVRDKAYHPARLAPEGRWRPGRVTAALLAAASIFPQPHQVAAFERSPAYLDMIYSDLEAYQKKMEERRQERARRRLEREQQQEQSQLDGTGGSREQPIILNLPPGSSKKPLHVRLEVQPDETVVLKVYIKSKYRQKKQKDFVSSFQPAEGAGVEAAMPRPVPQPLARPAADTAAVRREPDTAADVDAATSAAGNSTGIRAIAVLSSEGAVAKPGVGLLLAGSGTGARTVLSGGSLSEDLELVAVTQATDVPKAAERPSQLQPMEAEATASGSPETGLP